MSIVKDLMENLDDHIINPDYKHCLKIWISNDLDNVNLHLWIPSPWLDGYHSIDGQSYKQVSSMLTGYTQWT